MTTAEGTAVMAGLDQITVSGIRAFGHHGVLEHERRDGQTFLVDVMLGVDTRAAAASDDLADTVDYGAVAAAVVAEVTGPARDLIETLAEQIASACLAHAGVLAVRVTVHKPDAPVGVPFEDVTVQIERGRR